MKRILITIALAIILTGCGKLTLENYNKINPGMDYDRVIDLLGEPTGCDGMLGAKSCTWGEDGKHIKVKFIADNVVLFSQAGLK
ncbi:MAG: DUF3862 domain-containing protein [Moraxellaceae bacterium]|nr:MAG: DUF3862 domain-containing protein [Moraxellaceae bacterium]